MRPSSLRPGFSRRLPANHGGIWRGVAHFAAALYLTSCAQYATVSEIKSGIPYHTIAGDRGRGDAPNSSDGVVPYWSSHLPDARSELIVPSNHSAHRHPKAIEEVHRILAVHAASR